MVAGMSSTEDHSARPVDAHCAARTARTNPRSAPAATGQPPDSLRFLCDRMLIRLCRWLRAAGYDASAAGERASDRLLLTTATAEQRYLLTRDRKLLEHRAAAGRVIRLDAVHPGGQAVELAHRLPLDWLHSPFSRCLLCNVPLQLDSGHEAPLGSRGPLRHCPSCARLYWEGGHVRRMRAQLTAWRQGANRGMHRGDESSIL